jgi:hypothetical protein
VHQQCASFVPVGVARNGVNFGRDTANMIKLTKLQKTINQWNVLQDMRVIPLNIEPMHKSVQQKYVSPS